jgi:hypothetical protein
MQSGHSSSHTVLAEQFSRLLCSFELMPDFRSRCSNLRRLSIDFIQGHLYLHYNSRSFGVFKLFNLFNAPMVYWLSGIFHHMTSWSFLAMTADSLSAHWQSWVRIAQKHLDPSFFSSV